MSSLRTTVDALQEKWDLNGGYPFGHNLGKEEDAGRERKEWSRPLGKGHGRAPGGGAGRRPGTGTKAGLRGSARSLPAQRLSARSREPAESSTCLCSSDCFQSPRELPAFSTLRTNQKTFFTKHELVEGNESKSNSYKNRGN